MGHPVSPSAATIFFSPGQPEDYFSFLSVSLFNPLRKGFPGMSSRDTNTSKQQKGA
jgi:hypothetical protein